MVAAIARARSCLGETSLLPLWRSQTQTVPLISIEGRTVRREAPLASSPRTPAGMPSGRPWSSGSRSASTTAWSGSRGACSKGYRPSGQRPSGAWKPTAIVGAQGRKGGCRAVSDCRRGGARWLLRRHAGEGRCRRHILGSGRISSRQHGRVWVKPVPR